MGKNGLNAILNLAGLTNYIESYPADSLEKGFDFAELSAIGVALEEMYGPRGGRGLMLRAGRATLQTGLKTLAPWQVWQIWRLWFSRCSPSCTWPSCFCQNIFAAQ